MKGKRGVEEPKKREAAGRRGENVQSSIGAAAELFSHVIIYCGIFRDGAGANFPIST